MKKIYVDGELRHYEEADGGIYLDHPDLPMRRCAFIRFSRNGSFIPMLAFGSVVTSGHTFSLRAPETPATPVENGKKMCADCGLIALPPEQTYCAYCEAPPAAPASSAWDEIPRCLGYAIGAIMASGFMGGLLGYVWYTFTH